MRMSRHFNWKIKGANQENPFPGRGCPRYSNFYEYLYTHLTHILFVLVGYLNLLDILLFIKCKCSAIKMTIMSDTHAGIYLLFFNAGMLIK